MTSFVPEEDIFPVVEIGENVLGEAIEDFSWDVAVDEKLSSLRQYLEECKVG